VETTASGTAAASQVETTASGMAAASQVETTASGMAAASDVETSASRMATASHVKTTASAAVSTTPAAAVRRRQCSIRKAKSRNGHAREKCQRLFGQTGTGGHGANPNFHNAVLPYFGRGLHAIAVSEQFTMAIVACLRQ
jgi:hypothetical protein